MIVLWQFCCRNSTVNMHQCPLLPSTKWAIIAEAGAGLAVFAILPQKW